MADKQPTIEDYDPVFQAAGTEWNIDPVLLKAIAMQESGGRWNAYNKDSGAMGMMQIMPDTAKGLGMSDPYDPVQAIWGAAKYMDQALNAENGSVEQALLYYHGGPGWRDRFGKESQAYVPGIAKYYKQFAPPPPAQAAAGAP